MQRPMAPQLSTMTRWRLSEETPRLKGGPVGERHRVTRPDCLLAPTFHRDAVRPYPGDIEYWGEGAVMAVPQLVPSSEPCHTCAA